MERDDLSINEKAYFKIILHALKYSDKPVFGFLLGHRSGSKILVTDSVCLFHSSVLLPNVKQAYELVQLNSEEDILGVYESLLQPDKENTFSLMANSILDSLKAETDGIVIGLNLILNDCPRKTEDIARRPSLEVFNFDKKPTFKYEIEEPKSFTDKLKDLVLEKVHFCLADFEDHCEDLENDFFNSNLKL